MKFSPSPLPYLFLFLLCFSCESDKKALPPLTYTGTEPRVQDPLSPEDSRLHIQLPEGFTAELYAAEPDIINPIAFTWDERGRLWVVQSQDYPHALENEVGGDRITICEDTDGDGKADKFTDFATSQSLTTGIVKVKGGIIVAQAPDMVFLQDTDGDDVMDKSEVLFTGFGIWDTHAGPASLRYGIDNLLWGSVGYSGFEQKTGGKDISFKMGVFRFAQNGKYFEPVGQFNNNTWGLGFNENFEIFGSTANNNHACYVGIPLKHYEYLHKRPEWAINADFIQGHYEITPPDTITPLQQVDVRGGYTAAAGANFYTARNYPETYQNQMYVNEPTGHVVHIARIEKEGAGYKEVDGGNIFASTDAWTAPVFSETGPDGNLWVADWYNPVIQHNPDKRGMDNQIWNDNKGEGNAHINPLRDKQHGRIYILRYKKAKKSPITALDPDDDKVLLKALQSDNQFWRTTAQRLIVEGEKQQLISPLIEIAGNEKTGDGFGKLHALWTLEGLGAFAGGANSDLLKKSLASTSYAVQRAAISLLPASEAGSKLLAGSGLLTNENLQIRLAALLRAGELPETDALFQAVERLVQDPATAADKWLAAALKVYHKEQDITEVDPAKPKLKADVVFNLNTVNQKMAYDKTLLRAEAGQILEIRLNNADQMPHNLVVIQAGSLENFGKVVDAFLKQPDAEKRAYVPNSRYVLAATDMLEPGASGTIVFQLPDVPGRYPFVCTFPGHWQMMRGEILVSAPGSYLSENPHALHIATMGGGSSHDFLPFFGKADGKVLSQGGANTVLYTESGEALHSMLKDLDALVIANNQPFSPATQSAIFARVQQGMSLLIHHPGIWYNWKDWPQYNQELVGGGSRSHEKLQEFEVRVVKPDHPIMQGVPAQFRIVDELYRFEKDPQGTEIEVLAVGKGLESGEEYPVVWTVKHPKANIVCNTLGHDARAHGLPAYQAIISNSLNWVREKVNF